MKKVLITGITGQDGSYLAEFYNADTELKGIPSRERIQKRQELIKPMFEELYRLIME